MEPEQSITAAPGVVNSVEPEPSDLNPRAAEWANSLLPLSQFTRLEAFAFVLDAGRVYRVQRSGRLSQCSKPIPSAHLEDARGFIGAAETSFDPDPRRTAGARYYWPGPYVAQE
jgi:hypothetical protein